MDYCGSGIGWGFLYLWPASDWKVKNPQAWEFLSWQNMLVLAALLAWSWSIAVRQRRTPFELVAPEVHQRILGWLGASPSMHLQESHR
jgi:hypothetical protein